MFKVGDTVRFIKGGLCGDEIEEWWNKDGLMMGHKYTVEYILHGNICLYGRRYIHHTDHFELVKSYEQKEFIVKMTQDEVDTLLLACPLVGGYPTTSRYIFDEFNRKMILESFLHETVQPYKKYRSGSFYFEKRVK
jgi:hypothetical protein